MKELYFVIIGAILLVAVYVMAEISNTRKGRDVYDWAKKLVKLLDKK